MSEYKSGLWSIVAGVAFMWVAAVVVLVYNHNLLASQPLTDAARHQKEQTTYTIVGAFVLFNAVTSFLRFQQLRKNKPADSRPR